VFNNTKVVEARIEFRKPTGARIEIFCLEPPPEYGGVANALAQAGRVNWRCLIGGASKWKPGQVLRKEMPDGLVLEARYIEKEGDSFLIALSWSCPLRNCCTRPASFLSHPIFIVPRRRPTAGDIKRSMRSRTGR